MSRRARPLRNGQSGGPCSSGEAQARATRVYFTIDTEYEPGFTARHGLQTRRENFEQSIQCLTAKGAVGIPYQLDTFERNGIQAVFFIDPMPALLWGVEAITDIVEPIVTRGHDVQLHLHTEWLALAGRRNPLGERTGANIRDFTFDEQCRLLDYASTTLTAAGAARPIAFRAGNYGANDDTLRALAELGMAYDTSYSPGFSGSACAITLGSGDVVPKRHCGVIEVPIGSISAVGRKTRHAQITALSKRELLAAVVHTQRAGMNSFTLVSHSFELLSRDRKRINTIIKRRFDGFCTALAKLDRIETATYARHPPSVDTGETGAILPHNGLRTGCRMAEQALANALYGKPSKATAAAARAMAQSSRER